MQDVANFQLRTFRFPLISDTVSYFRNDILERTMQGTIDIRGCQMWYQRNRSSNSSLSDSAEEYATLFNALLGWLVLAPDTYILPESFQLEMERLTLLRRDLQDLLHLKQCIVVFKELCRCCNSGRRVEHSEQTLHELQVRILAIVPSDGIEGFDRWLVSSEEVALEIIRAAFLVCEVPSTVIGDIIIRSTAKGLSKRVAKIAHSKLESTLDPTVRQAHVFDQMTTLNLSMEQINWANRQKELKVINPLPVLEDIVRRLAHIGVLHWRIWAIYYLADAGQERGDSHE